MVDVELMKILNEVVLETLTHAGLSDTPENRVTLLIEMFLGLMSGDTNNASTRLMLTTIEDEIVRIQTEQQ